MDHARTLNVLLFIIVIIAVGVALKLMQPVLTLFLVALMLAYLIDPVMVVMDERLKLPLWAALPLTAILSLAVLSGIGVIVIRSLVEFTRDFDDFMPDIDQTLQNATDFVASRLGMELSFDPLDELRGLLLSSFNQVATAAQSVLRGVTSFLLVFFFALLFLSAKHHMTRSFADAFSHPRSSMPAILGQIDRSLHGKGIADDQRTARIINSGVGKGLDYNLGSDSAWVPHCYGDGRPVVTIHFTPSWNVAARRVMASLGRPGPG